jgi:hypothetical protein
VGKLAGLRRWQLWVLLLALGLGAAIAISVLIGLMWRLRPAVSILGAAAIVIWAFLQIRRGRAKQDEDWIG